MGLTFQEVSSWHSSCLLHPQIGAFPKHVKELAMCQTSCHIFGLAFN